MGISSKCQGWLWGDVCAVPVSKGLRTPGWSFSMQGGKVEPPQDFLNATTAPVQVGLCLLAEGQDALPSHWLPVWGELSVSLSLSHFCSAAGFGISPLSSSKKLHPPGQGLLHWPGLSL